MPKGERFVRIYRAQGALNRHSEVTKRFKLSVSVRSPTRRLVLSHQTPEPVEGAHNFGGFTDGDRAVCFALAIGVKRENIRLLGFSLREVGPWSATTVHELKLQKLAWMNRILTSVGLDGAVAK